MARENHIGFMHVGPYTHNGHPFGHHPPPIEGVGWSWSISSGMWHEFPKTLHTSR